MNLNVVLWRVYARRNNPKPPLKVLSIVAQFFYRRNRSIAALQGWQDHPPQQHPPLKVKCTFSDGFWTAAVGQFFCSVGLSKVLMVTYLSLIFLCCIVTHTHTHTHIYIYIYIIYNMQASNLFIILLNVTHLSYISLLFSHVYIYILFCFNNF